MITHVKIMTWNLAAANDVSNLASTSKLPAIDFTAALPTILLRHGLGASSAF